MKKKSSGVLLHISSLNGKYGIGDFGKCAYDFIDFLENSNQKYWQILPIGITGYGDSPYQTFSIYAGNPYFIDLDYLVNIKFLSETDLSDLKNISENDKINYEKLYEKRYPILKKAFEYFQKNYISKFESKNLSEIDFEKNIENEIYDEYIKFRNKNTEWIETFALYMTLKNEFKNISWIHWENKYRFKDKKTMKFIKEKFKNEINFHIFLQYLFFKQWCEIKKYANKKNIKIIGDLPIYISTDSADAWENPNLFSFNKKLYPFEVAGCPPDYFSVYGQYWGNVLYNWKELKRNNYDWWIKRIKFSMNLYDVIRIDHFRGFDTYWSIPAKCEVGKYGKWKKGPGIDLFNTIKNRIGNIDVIAEDLGELFYSVKLLLKNTGYPSMKILQFAFNGDNENEYLPHRLPLNCVAYTGTHDNQTFNSWYKELPENNKMFCDTYIKEFLEIENIDIELINWLGIESLMKSEAYLIIIPMQDFLNLDDCARMNIPSTLGGNWTWKMTSTSITNELAKKIFNIVKKYGRD